VYEKVSHRLGGIVKRSLAMAELRGRKIIAQAFGPDDAARGFAVSGWAQ